LTILCDKMRKTKVYQAGLRDTDSIEHMMLHFSPAYRL
jgi:hypothetical protein